MPQRFKGRGPYNKNFEEMVNVTVHVSKEALEIVDAMVASGLYSSRSDAVRQGMNKEIRDALDLRVKGQAYLKHESLIETNVDTSNFKLSDGTEYVLVDGNWKSIKH